MAKPAKQNFDGSINGLLINPFRGQTHDQMVRKTKDFMEITHIDDGWTEYFRKGAFLAQDDQAFNKEREDGLSLKKSEQDALRLEDPKTGNKWDQPFILYALVVCCSLGAAVQGWDETAVNQAQTQYSAPLGMGEHPVTNPTTILGLVNSAPYLCCAVAGCWLTDPLNRYLGRRGTIFVSCVIACATCLAQAFATTWPGMFIARFCLGFGMGPKSATVPVYASESAPVHIRGALVMMWQMWTAFGIMLGYMAGVVFQDVRPDLQWRLVIGSPCILPLVVCAYVFTLPESPRWLLEKARRGNVRYYDKAFASLRRLRRTPLQAARDLFLIYHMLEEEEKIRQQRNRFVELFSVPRNRRALRAGVIVMFFQQFCGVNVLAYYSSLIFQKAGYVRNRALQASMGFGIINFVFAIPAIKLIDGWGRRPLLIATFPLMAIFQLLTGCAFQAKEGSKARLTLVTLGMYLFSAAYSPGEGPVPFTYSSECMPLYVRALGMSVFTAVTWFCCFLLAITFPKFLQAFGPFGAFAYYAAWCVVGWVLIILFVPETGRQTLEALDARFEVPTKTHALFGLQQVRYYFNRYFLFRKGSSPPQLNIEFKVPVSAAMSIDPNAPRKIPIEKEVDRLASVIEMT
ncbi:MAG: hypothetical protein M1828_007035 [Chrysothrix sp. TS-e1954]|nr:MAG: hypothetical protein M1828_007035 [Chrysothrix sp. TS-e1954]